MLRAIGAAYLIGLGAVMVWRSLRRAEPTQAGEVVRDGARPMRRGWQAYVANVLNVKAASVYLTLAPQFVAAQGVGSMLSLAGVHIALMVV